MIAAADVMEAFPIGRRDRFGRIVARVSVDGVDIGEHHIARDLARPGRGRSSNFCS